MSPHELQKAEARYQRASRRAETEREQRNATVRKAITEGWTHAKIAEATGLTRGRIGQIAGSASAPGFRWTARRGPWSLNPRKGREDGEAL